MVAVAFVMLLAVTLCGGEISELVNQREDGRTTDMGHLVIPLMGCFKGETEERKLIMLLTNMTNGGLNIRK